MPKNNKKNKKRRRSGNIDQFHALTIMSMVRSEQGGFLYGSAAKKVHKRLKQTHGDAAPSPRTIEKIMADYKKNKSLECRGPSPAKTRGSALLNMTIIENYRTKIVHWWKERVAAKLPANPEALRRYANEHWPRGGGYEGQFPWPIVKKRDTVAKLLTRVGFQRVKNSHYLGKRDTPGNKKLLKQYLAFVKKMEADGYELAFHDETWFDHFGLYEKYVYTHQEIDTSKFSPPSDKGYKRFICSAVVTKKNGFVPGSFFTFLSEAKKKKDDPRQDSDSYKDEIMTNVDLLGEGDLPEKAKSGGNLFTRYLWQMAFPALKNASKKRKVKILLILDRATIHTMLVPGTRPMPMAGWTKPRQVEWLHSKKDTVKDKELKKLLGDKEKLGGMTQKELYKLANKPGVKPTEKFLVTHLAEEFSRKHGVDIRCCFLPVAMPELNPIELAWGFMKGICRREMWKVGFKWKELKKIVDETHPKLGSRNFEKMWEKSEKTRQLYAQNNGV